MKVVGFLQPPLSKTLLVLTLISVIVVLCGPAEAQQPKKIPRVGFMSGSGTPSLPSRPGRLTRVFAKA
jgi:hypothetical protein